MRPPIHICFPEDKKKEERQEKRGLGAKEAFILRVCTNVILNVVAAKKTGLLI